LYFLIISHFTLKRKWFRLFRNNCQVIQLETNFERLTASPETLAEFLKTVWSGKIQFDDLFCKGDCVEYDDLYTCPHEAECIEKWLNEPREGD